MSRPLACLALFVLFVAPAAAEKRAFTIEDFYRVRIPSGIAVSPRDGATYFALETRDLPRGRSGKDLWRVPAGRGEPQRLTFTETANESEPAVSPDGATLAFVADREAGAQIWLLPLGGGEARKLTSLSTGVAGPVWSPDGKRIAFASDVYPACGADDACNRKRAGERESAKAVAHVADDLLYRHWTQWHDGTVSHVLVVDVESGAVRDLTPGDTESPVFAPGGGADYSFSPDGAWLAYTRNPDPPEKRATSTNSDIFVVAVAPGPDGKTAAARNITAGNAAWDAEPRFSPDGTLIAFRRQVTPGFESDRIRLAVYDLATGTTRGLAESFDNWVTHFAWLPSGKEILFRADEKGRTPLYRVGLDGAAPRLVARFAQIDEFAAPDPVGVRVVRRAVDAPPEIWSLDLGGSVPPQRLTRFNESLEREVDLRPAETIDVKGADGLPVQCFLVKPHGFDPARKYPLILNVHGGPQMQWADAWRGDWQVYPGAGFIVAFPNPHGSTGFGQAYTDAISGDWGGKVMVDILAVTDALAALPYVDAERMGLMGWSWGGYAVNWLAGHTDRFKAMASMMGIFDLHAEYYGTEELWFPEWEMKGTPWTSTLYDTFNPARFVPKWKTPMLVVTGELDFRIPYTEGLATFTALRRQGVPAKLVVLPRSGHWPRWTDMALYYTAHLEWFHRFLGGDAPPWSSEDLAAGRVFDPETGTRRAP